MKTFALLSIVAAQDAQDAVTTAAPAEARQQQADGWNKSTSGQCSNLIKGGEMCSIDGRNDNNRDGDCYCDAACSGFNDCCTDMEYQCYNGVDELCPSVHMTFDDQDQGGCYTQEGRWNFAYGNDVDAIKCNMTNKDCLSVTCDENGIDANFRADLFHTNLENTASFIQQIRDGKRDLFINGVDMSNEENSQCGWSESATGIRINWDYTLCQANISPTMNSGKKIEYKIDVSSPGNAPGYPEVEFYVDTTAAATCQYDPNVKIEADGFWVNQEDVEAFNEAEGSLKKCFECKFYSDDARSNQIMEHNIVNMGERIYGSLISNCDIPGLEFKLRRLDVCDASVNDKGCVQVVKGGKGKQLFDTNINNSFRPFGQTQSMNYLSFGFEDLSNQNELEIKCRVKIQVASEDGTRTIGDFGDYDEDYVASLAADGYTADDYEE